MSMLVPKMLSLTLIAAAAAQDDFGRHVAAAKVPMPAAIARGTAAVGKGTVFHAELELDAGKLVHSIDVAVGDKVVNVVLDAADGHEVERSEDREDRRRLVGRFQVGIDAAITKALATVAGSVVEAQLLEVDGKPVVRVGIWTTARRDVDVDGVSGEVVGGAGSVPQDVVRFTDRFDVPASELVAHGRNPFFVLEPGYVLTLEGKDGKAAVQLVITVLAETRVVDGVACAIVEERETKDGQLAEVSRNYFALSTRTNDVYYFGEEVDIYRGGAIVAHEGAWLSGERGARFGLMMPGTPLLGARFQQEIAPEVAMDRVEVTALDATVATPLRQFERVLVMTETTPLEAGKSVKHYAAGIGLIGDGELKLVRAGKAGN